MSVAESTDACRWKQHDPDSDLSVHFDFFSVRGVEFNLFKDGNKLF